MEGKRTQWYVIGMALSLVVVVLLVLMAIIFTYVLTVDSGGDTEESITEVMEEAETTPEADEVTVIDEVDPVEVTEEPVAVEATEDPEAVEEAEDDTATEDPEEVEEVEEEAEDDMATEEPEEIEEEDETAEAEDTTEETMASGNMESYEVTAEDENTIFFITDFSDPTNGERMFNETYEVEMADGTIGEWACSTCHMVNNNDVGTGPGMLNLADRAGERIDGMPAPLYVYRSILNTNEYLVDGYESGVMPVGYADVFTEQELYDLSAYLMTLDGDESES
jgi:mono/diheme cytochrome c family protein